MQAISVQHLTKQYGNTVAVDDISFDVRPGELFALLGENGAGKSTTINILCTILQKSAGEAMFFGKRLGQEDDAIRRDIGVVFQNSVLDSVLSVKDNLYSRGAYYGYSPREIRERLQPFIEPFGLGELMGRRYGTLSGGQRRRVDIIRALIHQPKILFLDEPTTGLDPQSRKTVWDYITKLRTEQNLTLFLTTHYMEETRDADTVVILDRGKIIASDTPSALKSRYTQPRVVWYAPQTAENTARLQGEPHHYDGDHYNIFPREPVSDFLYRCRDFLLDFEVIKGSMDDVFLRLTGKEFQK